MVMITKNDGEIVTHEYLRKRAMKYLARWNDMFHLHQRRQAVVETVDNHDWLKVCEAMTVGAVCRKVENYLIDELDKEKFHD